MKKRLCLIFVALIITFALGGCKDAVNSENSDTTSTSSETSSSSAPSDSVETSSINIQIDIATDELLGEYDSFYEYVNDEDGERLIIWTDKEVEDFAFISVDYEDTEDEIAYHAGNILYSIDELSPKKPFVVKLLTPGLVPAYGVSFLDENGVERYYTINLSGRDPEEAPPYFLLEFENETK